MTVQRLEIIRQAALNLQRQRAQWLETFERLQAVRPRNDEERQAQYEALELLKSARP